MGPKWSSIRPERGLGGARSAGSARATTRSGRTTDGVHPAPSAVPDHEIATVSRKGGNWLGRARGGAARASAVAPSLDPAARSLDAATCRGRSRVTSLPPRDCHTGRPPRAYSRSSNVANARLHPVARARRLAPTLVPTPVESALDLGTGCGIQALHLARHARRVVATDISARALDLARFNAALNGVESIEFRHGSLFDPVAGERFDRVASNPPFVITPRTDDVPAYEYRDGGMVGDDLVATVIAGLRDHLTDGGMAQLLGNWEYRERDGLDRVADWVDAAGLDAWVVERERQSVEAYAETWIRDGGTRPGPEFDRLSGRWLDDFERRGVTEVGFGYLTLRRPAASPTLRRIERYDAPLGGALGEHIASVFAAHDWRRTHDLRDATLTLAPDVTEERHYWPGAEDPTVMLLRQGTGFARTVPMGTALAAVVGACDGELPVGVIAAAVADLLEVDAHALLEEILPVIAELVDTGFLRA